MTDPAALLIPGTPLLLSGVDPCEPEEMASLRSAVHSVLVRTRTWTVRVPGSALPPVASLGGLGLAVGARIHAEEPAGPVVPMEYSGPGGVRDHAIVEGTSRPSDLLRGDELVTAVKELDEASVRTALQIPTGVLVAVLAGLEAGVDVRLIAGGDGCTAPSAAPLVVPLDFSGAAHPEAPLAPREGAVAFDEELERALTGSVDLERIAALQDRAGGHAAWIDMLATLELAGARGVGLASADVHHVRYRVFALEADAPLRVPRERQTSLSGWHA
ncbi:hypothetical protein [Brevibacterium yomogidense]|uniref:hypothetical protein n=1 Tax=Brevibacterium yomogidense TaxID=946573 RepID=UPI0018E00C39|nr:hypothetical protein [Brevibacterium yomogidense]